MIATNMLVRVTLDLGLFGTHADEVNQLIALQ
jgi:hypothetical protein